MSTGALAGALVSGLVWLGVLSLFGLAWVDDHRRENEEAYNNSRAAVRSRSREAPVAPPVVTLPPSEPAAVPAEAAKPPEPEPAGFWQIHTLQNGEGS